MRRTELQLTYENKDISAGIAPYVERVVYTDHAHGKADDLQITLEDVDGLWRGSWFPEKGASVRAGLRCLDWLKAGVNHTLPFGVFTIDEVEFSGPPALVTLKAVSAATTTALRREKRSKGWENTNLAAVALEISRSNGLKLFYDADEGVEFKRVDQREESDLSFLARICQDNGFNLKVSEEKLIVFQGKKFDSRPAALFLKRTDSNLKRFRFASKSHDVFRACRVAYHDPDAKEEKIYTFIPPDTPASGHVLKINKRATSLADAEKMARAELRRRNKGEVNGELSWMGRPDLLAGINVQVEGFGVYDGKYTVEEARHAKDSQGYQSSVKIRKVLSY